MTKDYLRSGDLIKVSQYWPDLEKYVNVCTGIIVDFYTGNEDDPGTVIILSNKGNTRVIDLAQQGLSSPIYIVDILSPCEEMDIIS